ncbi:ribonuclease H-like domain-containing protein [Abortiporus biennis]|nr:ribonuclease H-like domain-containing protein [Abortiporus biennis]
MSINSPTRNPKSTSTSSTKRTSSSSTRISNLPLYHYKDYHPTPAVVYTQNEEEADDLVQMLHGPLGFDLEWALAYKGKGRAPSSRRTAVVQLSDKRMILVIQITRMKKFPQKLKEIIESPHIVKTGANIRNDGVKLYNDFGILAAGLVELGSLAHIADPQFSTIHSRQIVSLHKMVARYTSKHLDKNDARTSNWEANGLSQMQIDYAANDAHCALTVFNSLLEHSQQQGLSSESLKDAMKLRTADLKEDYRKGKLLSKQTLDRLRNFQIEVIERSPQFLRTYKMWYQRGMALDDICIALRTRENPLAHSTVISYVVKALQTDPSLPYCMTKLKAFVQLEISSWDRHRDWILSQGLQKNDSTTNPGPELND